LFCKKLQGEKNMKKRIMSMLMTIMTVITVIPYLQAEVAAVSSPLFPVDLDIGVWCAFSYYGGHNANTSSYRAVDITRNHNPDRTADNAVYAAEDGVIVHRNDWNGEIVIRHTIPLRTMDGYEFQTWYTAYFHMRPLTTKGRDQTVQRGEWLGEIGAGRVGRSSGPNLHFSVNSQNPITNHTTHAHAISPLFISWANASHEKANPNLNWHIHSNRCPATGSTNNSNSAPEKLTDYYSGNVTGASRIRTNCSNHDWNNQGICTRCEKRFPLEITHYSPRQAFRAVPASDANPANTVPVRWHPYAPYGSVRRLNAGEIVTVIGETTNHWGNVWYRLSDYTWVFSERLRHAPDVAVVDRVTAAPSYHRFTLD
jgi:hypothetical protein